MTAVGLLEKQPSFLCLLYKKKKIGGGTPLSGRYKFV